MIPWGTVASCTLRPMTTHHVPIPLTRFACSPFPTSLAPADTHPTRYVHSLQKSAPELAHKLALHHTLPRLAQSLKMYWSRQSEWSTLAQELQWDECMLSLLEVRCLPVVQGLISVNVRYVTQESGSVEHNWRRCTGRGSPCCSAISCQSNLSFLLFSSRCLRAGTPLGEVFLGAGRFPSVAARPCRLRVRAPKSRVAVAVRHRRELCMHRTHPPALYPPVITSCRNICVYSVRAIRAHLSSERVLELSPGDLKYLSHDGSGGHRVIFGC